ncbi:O-methyltransferase [Lachnellula hyalina]|uniref:O-methyltransferase n=1 Tax=Lachnellula hyalina TaxID=1316788 RepID=A0A8H8U0C0_9HELO|nr:O-methyltransferase [Lachnellula hyalina]TVY26782.1 O-methyltransferase [Lachnellula hyalina]
MATSNSDLVRKAEAILASAKSFKGDRAERYELMKQVDLFYQDLEDPMDAMLKQFSSTSVSTSLAVMVASGAFEKMPKQGSITAKELGALVKIEPNVIARLMRMLTGTGIIELTGDDTYAHTPKSLVYLQGAAVDFWNLCTNFTQCFLRFPEYFKTKTPEDLIDLRKTPYSFAYGAEGLTFYEVLASKPETLNMFNKAMMQQEASLPTLGMFPFASLKNEVEAEPQRAFVVDIGGGRGQSLLLIQQETSNGFGTSSKMILQDKPHVLDTIPPELVPGIEKVPYDFYTEQPIKNAHIYYIRRIMHNYQDNVCKTILENIAKAMGPTSRLLIAEIIVPARTTVGEDMSTYWMDMVMLGIGGKERRANEFSDLLQSVGLELVKIWPAKVGNQAVVEARLKGA